MSTYFPEHLPRRQYEELSEMYSPKDAHGWGDKVLMQALMRRAIVDVQRILQMREEKPQLQALVRSGVVGEAMLENITLAEKETEEECQAVVAEAELYRPGWGQNIFQEAQAVLQQQMQLQAQAQQATGATAASATTAATAATSEGSPRSSRHQRLPRRLAGTRQRGRTQKEG
ncbi:translocation protein sec66 [Obelidium mucronatum]|nr:translocation protein sec66 [Obelidium mucronatum]